MRFPQCLHCEGRCFVGANHGNVIVSREGTTETCVGSVKTMLKCDLYNGPPVGFGFMEVNPLQMFYFGCLVQKQEVKRNFWRTSTALSYEMK